MIANCVTKSWRAHWRGRAMLSRAAWCALLLLVSTQALAWGHIASPV